VTQKTLSIRLKAALATFALTFLVTVTRAVAQEEKVLYDFTLAGHGGASPLYGDLITDGSGNLYGTTSGGGAEEVGAVFELSPPVPPSKHWKETPLYNFSVHDGGIGGTNPVAALLFDPSYTNLYGTTLAGGAYGYGTVFELTPPIPPKTFWEEYVLHSFNRNGTDGYSPYAGLIMDSAGNLYGTTYSGGVDGLGTVFELKPPAEGKKKWKEYILHSFQGNPIDGANPEAGLTLDGGNLYGTTVYGDNTGTYNAGTVFELTPGTGGSWNYTGVLWSFSNNGKDGSEPGYGSLLFDGSGNLYGTTAGGGTSFLGTVFEMSPEEGGGWSETVLYSFGGGTADGGFPYSGLVSDITGNLYGTTSQGGKYADGTVFELSTDEKESLLWSFSNNGKDGIEPYAGLVFDSVTGDLYGTTPGGGTHTYGTVFQAKP
jgi:uncharacterized repeat protein (TIGR03803 family)